MRQHQKKKRKRIHLQEVKGTKIETAADTKKVLQSSYSTRFSQCYSWATWPSVAMNFQACWYTPNVFGITSSIHIVFTKRLSFIPTPEKRSTATPNIHPASHTANKSKLDVSNIDHPIFFFNLLN